VINYRTEDVAARFRDITGGAGVDHVVDVGLGGNLVATLGSLRMGGRMAFQASNTDRQPRVSAAMLMQENLTIRGMVLPSVPHDTRRRGSRGRDRGSRAAPVASTANRTTSSNHSNNRHDRLFRVGSSMVRVTDGPNVGGHGSDIRVVQ